MNFTKIRDGACIATCVLLGVVFVSAATGSPELRAAEPSGAVPRYRLVPGEELQYHDDFEFKYGKDLAKSYGDIADWQVWVARTNHDGSWHLILHKTTNSWMKSKPDANRREEPAEHHFGFCELSRDGRVFADDGLALRLDPSALFPRLPPDDASVRANGWRSDEDDGFVHCELALDQRRTTENVFSFDVVRRSLFGKVYLLSDRSTYSFDRERGLIERIERVYTQGYGFDGKGGGTTELRGIKNHDTDWIAHFANDADRYFNRVKEYDGMFQKAGEDAVQADAILAKAQKLLKDARAEFKQSEILGQLDSKIADHDQHAKWAIEDAKRIAAHKGKPAADWKLDDLAGKSHSMADYRGKVVVLDFWYRGCGWCMRAMPQVQQLADDFKNRPVAVLGMNTDQNPKDAQFVVDAMHLTYPILKANGDVSEKCGTCGFPTLIVVDQKGIVREFHVGYSKSLREEVSKTIGKLLAGGD